ncbi:arabinosyltransferase domain-containing protein [Pseudonocardia phyllosphaerae]|uniref:arabinosyltransferase domain-containing protein n=1 Tax=Pseudonocardia phyllosphaerae TaxID=3390502 RepID=UPI003978012F
MSHPTNPGTTRSDEPADTTRPRAAEPGSLRAASTASGGRRAAITATIAGLVALLLAALVPFAQVITRDTIVTWPQAGEAPSSTTAAFVPAAPESVRITLPCTVLRAADTSDATVVSSEPVGKPNIGFTVVAGGGDVRVLVGGQELVREPLGDGDCGRVVTADEAGTTVTAANGGTRSFPGAVVRAIGAFATALPAADATGLQVTARTADWFAASPTVLKVVLVVAQWLAAAVAAVLLVRLAGDRVRARPGLRRRLRARLGLRGLARAAVDVVVLGTLAAWVVLGPLSTDDGFTEAIARNATGAGDFGNVYRWGNASEAPYTLVLRMVKIFVDAGAGPLELRVPAMVAGALTWLLLSRVALPALLPRHRRRIGVRIVLAVALLAWWLPLNSGVRPEPFAALFAAAALACGLRAAARPGGRTGLWIAGTALASGLALAVTPSSISVAGPLLLLVPALWRRVTRTGGTRTGVAAAVAAAGVAAAGLVTVFTTQSLYTVSRATQMHAFYGPDVRWYDEVRRWVLLLGFDTEQGGLGRRLPVLLAVALLVAALPLVARGAHHWTPGLRWTPVPLAGLVLGFALLTPAPSKWTHYFGTLAGPGALAVVAGAVLIVGAARARPHDPTVRGAAASGTLAVVLAAALVFAGRNAWFLWSQWAVPRRDGPFGPLASPALWLVVALVLAGAALLLHRRFPLPAVPAALTVTALVTGVAVVAGSMVAAPARSGGGYSVAGQLADELTGEPTCGILDHVRLTVDSPGALKTAGGSAGSDELRGFTAGKGWAGDAPPDKGPAWGSHSGGGDAGTGATTGELTTRWFALPKTRDDQQLAVAVAGRTGQGNTVELQFGRGDDPAPIGTASLDDTRTSPDVRGEYPTERVDELAPLDRPGWRTVPVPRDAAPAGADRVRVHAVDTTTDPAGWVAAAAPRVRTLAPAVPMLRDADGPVYVDWSILWAAPCLRDLPTVRAGLAQTPRYLVLGPSSLGFALDVSFSDGAGGSFAAMRRTTSETGVGTRVDTADDPDRSDWGSISRIDTGRLARDAYDVTSTGVTRWGWQGDRSPLGFPEKPAP